MHPYIGVTCNPNFSDEINQREYRHYLRAVEAAGGIPTLIPSVETFLAQHSQLDGLILPGGCDIHPSFYGEEEHSLLGEGNRSLDELELTIFGWALQENLPTLGICRGMQIINVVLGGTLYQDLGDQYPHSLNHRMRDEPRCHQVAVQADSLMEQILGTSQFWVNSRHHQAIKKPGKGIRLSGFADDGVAELCEAPGYRFIIGAQCHPEEIYADVSACASLFSALVEKSTRVEADEKSYQFADAAD